MSYKQICSTASARENTKMQKKKNEVSEILDDMLIC